MQNNIAYQSILSWVSRAECIEFREHVKKHDHVGAMKLCVIDKYQVM
jgi:hypothetical protein